MKNPEKISLQFELLNTYYSKIACKMSHTPKNTHYLWNGQRKKGGNLLTVPPLPCGFYM